MGEGDRAEIVVQVSGKNVIRFQTSAGRVQNLTLRQTGGGPLFDVVQASGADVSSFLTSAGLIVNLALRQTGGGPFFGVDIGQGHLELEDCDISSAGRAGVAIHHGADPHLRRNRIHDGKQSGVYIYENGHGILEDNDIFANAPAGVIITTGGNPMLRGNRINKNVYAAIWISERGAGTFEDNDLRDNAGGAWGIWPDCLSNVLRSGNIE